MNVKCCHESSLPDATLTPAPTFHNPVSPIPAIVIAYGLNGLCTVRSLAHAGIPVVALVESPTEPAARSRLCASVARRPDERLRDAVQRVMAHAAIRQCVLVATSDASVCEIAAELRHFPAGVHFPGPSAKVADLLRDKRGEVEVVRQVSPEVPRTVTHLPLAAEQLGAFLRFPIIIKPRTQELGTTHGLKNAVANDMADVHAFYERFAAHLDDFIAQEIVPGDDGNIWQCNAVFNGQHDIVSAFTFRKLGMTPPHFGVTTLGRSEANPELVALVAAIGRAIGYVGPAGFEFKWDSDARVYRYIETNPRLGMTNWFDTACGVNTVLASYHVALGLEMTRPQQSEGRYFVDLFADAYSRLILDREPLQRVLLRYAGLLRVPRTGAYWSWGDAGPGLASLRVNLRRLREAGLRRVSRVSTRPPLASAAVTPESAP